MRTSEVFCLGVGLAAGAGLVVGLPYLRKNVLAKLVAPGGTLNAVYTVIAEKVALEIEKLQDEAAEPADAPAPADGPPSPTVHPSAVVPPSAAAG
jgi:hypothetical protein